MIGTLEQRFQSKVDDSAACWLWTGALTSAGYGCIWDKGALRLAHRVAYEMYVGPIPEGLVLDHLCRTRRCVNWHHLEAVTYSVNILRGEMPEWQCPDCGRVMRATSKGRHRAALTNGCSTA